MDPNRTAKLVRRISQNDEEAFNELYHYFYPKLIQVALTFVPGIIAAQEVVSDVFYKLLKNPKNLGQVNNFNQYIFLSVKNQSFTYLKKNKYNNVMDSVDQTADYLLPDLKNPEQSILSDELFQLVNKVVQNLPPKRKAIYMLVKEEGKKYNEVAEILGISVKTVEMQMFHALKVLRKAVKYYLESKDVKVKPIKKYGFLSFFI